MEIKRLLHAYYNALASKNGTFQSIVYTRLTMLGLSEAQIIDLLKKEFKGNIIVRKATKKKKRKK